MDKKEVETKICTMLNSLGITMFGARISNTSGTGRPSYDIHPYSKQGTGVNCVIICQLSHSDNYHVLLAKKHNKTQYDQIGGYTHGIGPIGSDKDYETRSEEEKDRDEEALLGNEIHCNAKSSASKPHSNYSLNSLKHASLIAFRRAHEKKLGCKMNPFFVKQTFEQQGIICNEDYNAWETALREIQEETGLDLKHIKPKELYTSDDFAISNEAEQLNTKTTHYLFYLGKVNQLPAIRASSDLEQVKWVKIDKINPHTCQVDDIPIRASFAMQTLPRAIQKVRHMDLEEVSHGRFSKYKNLNETKPSNPFSLEAAKNHQRVIEKAKALSIELDNQIEKFAHQMKA